MAVNVNSPEAEAIFNTIRGALDSLTYAAPEVRYEKVCKIIDALGVAGWLRADVESNVEPLPRGRLVSIGDLPDPEDTDYIAAPGHGFAVVEMSVADLRRAPVFSVVELRKVGE